MSMRDKTNELMHEFKSGARRSSVAPRFDLIPRAGMRRLALRFSLGAEKYGDWNWQKGLKDKEFVNQFKAHMMQHMMDFLEEGCEKDDNLAAIAWGAFALMEVEDKHGIEAIYSRKSIERKNEQGGILEVSANRKIPKKRKRI